MIKETKCPKCEKWQPTNGESSAQCVFCDAYLHPDKRVREVEKRRIEKSKPFFILIHKNDQWYVKIYKWVFNVVQLVFVSIVSFVVWLVTLLAG
jgi:hypothetical protein